MDASIFRDAGKAIILLFIIALIAGIGAWELLKWLISNIDISISWRGE